MKRILIALVLFGSVAQANQTFVCAGNGDVNSNNGGDLISQEVHVISDGRVFVVDVTDAGRDRYEEYYQGRSAGEYVYGSGEQTVRFEKTGIFAHDVSIVVGNHHSLCNEE